MFLPPSQEQNLNSSKKVPACVLTLEYWSSPQNFIALYAVLILGEDQLDY